MRPGNYRRVVRRVSGSVGPGPIMRPGGHLKKRPYPRIGHEVIPPSVVDAHSANIPGFLQGVFRSPKTHTPTVTGTGVTSASGGNMPGAPPTTDWAHATPAQMAQAMLQPQYQSLESAEHMRQLMASQQQAAITSYGADLVKLIGQGNTYLPKEYGAALSMAALRQFSYDQFLATQKYADDRAQVAAQYPTYFNQAAAQQAEQAAAAAAAKLNQQEMKLKQQAFRLQQQVAAQTYGLNYAKTQNYIKRNQDLTRQGNVRLQQSQAQIKLAAARFGLSVQQYKLQVAKASREWKKWNSEQASKATKVNVSLSKAYGYPVNDQGRRIKGAAPIPPRARTGANTGGGKAKDIDIGSSSKLGHWVYEDLTPVPKSVIRKRRLGKVPSRYKKSKGSAVDKILEALEP